MHEKIRIMNILKVTQEDGGVSIHVGHLEALKLSAEAAEKKGYETEWISRAIPSSFPLQETPPQGKEED